MPFPRRFAGPIRSQKDVIRLVRDHNGATLTYLSHCTEAGLKLGSEQSLYHRLQLLEQEGYIQRFLDQAGKRVIHRYFLTARAYETYLRGESAFKPQDLLPELKYQHDHRRELSEKYTPADFAYNGRLISDLFTNAEAPPEAIIAALELYDGLGQGLGLLYEGKELEASIQLDNVTHSVLPGLVGHLHVAYWAVHTMNRALVEASRILTPGPGEKMTEEKVHEGIERFKTAWAECFKAPDVDQEALEFARKLAAAQHEKEAREGKTAIDRRLSDAEAERVELERQAEQFRLQRFERELDLDRFEGERLAQARKEREARGEYESYEDENEQ